MAQTGSLRPTQVVTQQQQRRVKAVFFDFMGTCLDWHSSVVSTLPQAIPEPVRSAMALDWRQEFFDELHARSRQGVAPEDIDVTHRRTLLRILEREPYKDHRHCFFVQGLPEDSDVRESPTVDEVVGSWHSMAAWPDVLPALLALKRDLGLELFVLANGTTRLQLDLVKSSGLGEAFDMLFSSELLGVYKPAPESYNKALDLVRVEPESAVMVAAHAYDTRAARALGFKTVYVYRWTDDRNENMESVERENDYFLGEGGMRDLFRAIKSLS